MGRAKTNEASIARAWFGAVVVIMLACNSGTGSEQELGTSSECTPGLERCECLPSGGCDRGLECRSDLCVEADVLSTDAATGERSGNADTNSDTTSNDDDGAASSDDGAASSAGNRADDGTISGAVADPSAVGPDAGAGSDGTSAEPATSGATETSRDPEASTETAPASDEEADGTPGGVATAGNESSDVTLPSATPPPGGTPITPGVAPTGCGDGVLGSDEYCDDGNRFDGDGCSASCLSIEPGFLCSTPGRPCLPYATCGDGMVAPSEQCDDQNLQSGDGCSENCSIELGSKCEGEPSLCSPTLCGDGIVEGSESCDDGNDLSDDGCSADCLVEPECSGDVDCESICGDGLVIAEECDDHNLLDGDGCSSSCTLEAGFLCVTRGTDQASECTALCGDGVLSFGEQCDDGVNAGGYAECGPDCRLDGYCGDGIVNGPEECDPGPVSAGLCPAGLCRQLRTP